MPSSKDKNLTKLRENTSSFQNRLSFCSTTLWVQSNMIHVHCLCNFDDLCAYAHVQQVYSLQWHRLRVICENDDPALNGASACISRNTKIWITKMGGISKSDYKHSSVFWSWSWSRHGASRYWSSLKWSCGFVTAPEASQRVSIYIITWEHPL